MPMRFLTHLSPIGSNYDSVHGMIWIWYFSGRVKTIYHKVKELIYTSKVILLSWITLKIMILYVIALPEKMAELLRDA